VYRFRCETSEKRTCPYGDSECRWRNSNLRRGGDCEIDSDGLFDDNKFNNGTRRLVSVVGSISFAETRFTCGPNLSSVIIDRLLLKFYLKGTVGDVK
jgi:hypothetical protein